MDSTRDNPSDALANFGLVALTTGAAGVSLCAVGFILSPTAFFRAWLVGWLPWFGMGFGCLVIALLQRLVAGAWGRATRFVFEAGAATIPLLAAMYVPLVFGMRDLYLWTHEEVVAESHLLEHKRPYLNEPFFLIRTGIYFAVWIAVAWILVPWSRRAAESGEDRAHGGLQRFAAFGTIAVTLAVSFAAIDWIMSLEPTWFSTIFPLIVGMGWVVGAMSLGICVVWRLAEAGEPRCREIVPSGDLGSLLLAFLMIWAYLSFSQFLLIWSGNLPDEILWYIHRLRGGWEWLAWVVLLLGFIAPFLLLISRETRRHIERLAAVALALVTVRFVETFWRVKPAWNPESVSLHWLDLSAIVGIGGLWLAGYLWFLRRRLRRDARTAGPASGSWATH